MPHLLYMLLEKKLYETYQSARFYILLKTYVCNNWRRLRGRIRRVGVAITLSAHAVRKVNVDTKLEDS